MQRTFQPIALFICTLAALFYLYEFSLQVSLGVMTQELMHDMQLNAAGIGIISAAYYYAYTPMQIPAGILHDKFGPRYVLTVAVFSCALGALFFASSKQIVGASFGRFLMGLGSACSFSGALLLIARWFPPTYFAVLSGIVQLMSAAGAVGGELPLAIAIQHLGWQNSMLSLAIIGGILAIAIWLFVRDTPTALSIQNKKQTEKKDHRLKNILLSKHTWWIAGYSFCIWAPAIAFAGLWGIPFLKVSHHLTTQSASFACGMIWIGIGIGSPLIGWLSEYLQKRLILLTFCGIFGCIASIVIIYIHLSLPALYLCLFIFGLSCCGQSLAFCVVHDLSHPRTIGTSIGINNMATVASGAILQPLIGWLLYFHWDGRISFMHTPIYSATDYRMGLLVVPCSYALAAFISLFYLPETHCRPRYMIHAS